MSYTNDIIDDIKKIKNRLSYLKDDFNRLDYKAIPDLLMLEDIISSEEDIEEDSLAYSTKALRWLMDTYNIMLKPGKAIMIGDRLLGYDLKLLRKYSKNEYIEASLYDIAELLKLKDCYDIANRSEIVKLFNKYIPEKSLNNVINTKSSFVKLKHDPIELSEEYFIAMIEVDKIIEEANILPRRGACHKIWQIQERELAKRGVEWRSPREMNPHVRFD